MHSLALLAALALAQVPLPLPFPGTRDLGATSTPSGIVDWSACGGSSEATKGGPLLLTRAGTEQCGCTDGTWTSAPADKVCVSDRGGWLGIGGRNYLPNSGTISASGWVAYNSTLSVANGPDGAATGVAFGPPNGGDARGHGAYQRYNATGLSNRPWTFSGAFKAGAAPLGSWVAIGPEYTGTESYANVATCTAGTPASGDTVRATNIGAGWCFVEVVHTLPLSSVDNYLLVEMATGDGGRLANNDATSSMTIAFMQAEPGVFATSPHLTAGTAVVFGNNLPTISTPFRSDGRWGARMDIKPARGGLAYDEPDKHEAFAIGTLFADDYAALRLGRSGLFAFNSGGLWKQIEFAYDTVNGNKFFVTANGGEFKVYLDGIEPAQYASAEAGATGRWVAPPGTVYLGGTVDRYPLNGWAQNIRFLGTNSLNKLGFVPASPTKVAALGDSITAGEAWYPVWLNGLLGSEYQVVNHGVSGDTAAGALARYRSNIHGHGYAWLSLLIGTDDIAGGATAAATWATISTILDEALADGLEVVLVSLLPRGECVAWTGPLQVQLEALNALMASHGKGVHVRYLDAYTPMAGPCTGVDAGTPNICLAAAYQAGDCPHPNRAGKEALAALVKAQVAP